MRLTSSVSRIAATCGAVGISVLSGLGGVGAAATPAFAAGPTQNYLVVFKASQIPPGQAAKFARAGGKLITTYDQIGVALASSNNVNFRGAVITDPNVDDVASTAGLGYKLPNLNTGSDSTQRTAPTTPSTDADSLSPLQWDMRQIKTPQAHAITGGSPAVLVGDIDTGVDFNHPDLKANLDVAKSANCVSGVPVAGLAAQDDAGHGTHTAGTIAAAANGIGIVGVAPNVRLAAIKAGNADGFFFPEAVICAFMWAGNHHMDVTNNSYFADPYLFNCRNDATQRAIWKAEDRAIRFAMQQGVSVVAAEGNESDDLTHPTQDVTSPDNGTAVKRPVTNACVVIPVEIPGVVGVTADGNQRQNPADPNSGYLKSFYSSYGMGVTQVVAPGGDSRWGRTAEAVNGRVLSTWPAPLAAACPRPVSETGTDPNEPVVWYCYLQGTSMASPHAVGVEALIISQFGKMKPGQVTALLDQTADPQPCPASLPGPTPFSMGMSYSDIRSVSNDAPQVCRGGIGYNAWYGHGQVNALNAVTHTQGTPMNP